jgi:hypothetical protein
VDRIEIASCAEVPDLAAYRDGVCLVIADMTGAEALITRLAAAFPERSVFKSGPQWITVLPVVSRARILERVAAVRAAIADFLATRRMLMEHYRAGTLDPDWDADEHGADCTFSHFHTGQVVEAPLWADQGQVDPMFFATFVKTTPAHAAVAALLERDFHDAARILETVT